MNAFLFTSKNRLMAAVVWITAACLVWQSTGAAQSGVHAWPRSTENPSAQPGKLLDRMEIPYDLGITRARHDSGGEEVIIQIEDAHASIGAQKGIAKIFESLATRYDLNLIGLEGSTGEVDPALLSAFPDKAVRTQVAESLLRDTKISSAEFFKIVSGNAVELIGIEDPMLYGKNILSYQELLGHAPRIQSECVSLRKSIRSLESEVFSEAMLDFNLLQLRHQEGEIEFAEYWNSFRNLIRQTHVPLDEYTHLRRLVQTTEREKQIDFDRAGRERDALITVLKPQLSENDLEDLVEKSLAFKLGKMGPGAFHTHLAKLAGRYDIEPSEYRNVILYAEYAALYETIDLIAVMDQISEVEEKIKQSLFENDDQRNLHQIIRAVRILSRFLETKITPDDETFYRSHPNLFRTASLRESIKDLRRRYNLTEKDNVDWGYLQGRIPQADRFYYWVKKRNDTLLKNLTQRMRDKGVKVAALVSGGFHTKGLSDLMSQNRISHWVILPKFTSKEGERPYATVITQKGSYMDRRMRRQARMEAIALVLTSSVKNGHGIAKSKRMYLDSYTRKMEQKGYRFQTDIRNAEVLETAVGVSSGAVRYSIRFPSQGKPQVLSEPVTLDTFQNIRMRQISSIKDSNVLWKSPSAPSEEMADIIQKAKDDFLKNARPGSDSGSPDRNWKPEWKETYENHLRKKGIQNRDALSADLRQKLDGLISDAASEISQAMDTVATGSIFASYPMPSLTPDGARLVIQTAEIERRGEGRFVIHLMIPSAARLSDEKDLEKAFFDDVTQPFHIDVGTSPDQDAPKPKSQITPEDVAEGELAFQTEVRMFQPEEEKSPAPAQPEVESKVPKPVPQPTAKKTPEPQPAQVREYRQPVVKEPDSLFERLEITSYKFANQIRTFRASFYSLSDMRRRIITSISAAGFSVLFLYYFFAPKTAVRDDAEVLRKISSPLPDVEPDTPPKPSAIQKEEVKDPWWYARSQGEPSASEMDWNREPEFETRPGIIAKGAAPAPETEQELTEEERLLRDIALARRKLEALEQLKARGLSQTPYGEAYDIRFGDTPMDVSALTQKQSEGIQDLSAVSDQSFRHANISYELRPAMSPLEQVVVLKGTESRQHILKVIPSKPVYERLMKNTRDRQTALERQWTDLTGELLPTYLLHEQSTKVPGFTAKNPEARSKAGYEWVRTRLSFAKSRLFKARYNMHAYLTEYLKIDNTAGRIREYLAGINRSLPSNDEEYRGWEAMLYSIERNGYLVQDGILDPLSPEEDPDALEEIYPINSVPDWDLKKAGYSPTGPFFAHPGAMVHLTRLVSLGNLVSLIPMVPGLENLKRLISGTIQELKTYSQLVDTLEEELDQHPAAPKKFRNEAIERSMFIDRLGGELHILRQALADSKEQLNSHNTKIRYWKKELEKFEAQKVEAQQQRNTRQIKRLNNQLDEIRSRLNEYQSPAHARRYHLDSALTFGPMKYSAEETVVDADFVQRHVIPAKLFRYRESQGDAFRYLGLLKHHMDTAFPDDTHVFTVDAPAFEGLDTSEDENQFEGLKFVHTITWGGTPLYEALVRNYTRQVESLERKLAGLVKEQQKELSPERQKFLLACEIVADTMLQRSPAFRCGLPGSWMRMRMHDALSPSKKGPGINPFKKLWGNFTGELRRYVPQHIDKREADRQKIEATSGARLSAGEEPELTVVIPLEKNTSPEFVRTAVEHIGQIALNTHRAIPVQFVVHAPSVPAALADALTDDFNITAGEPNTVAARLLGEGKNTVYLDLPSSGEPLSPAHLKRMLSRNMGLVLRREDQVDILETYLTRQLSARASLGEQLEFIISTLGDLTPLNLELMRVFGESGMSSQSFRRIAATETHYAVAVDFELVKAQTGRKTRIQTALMRTQAAKVAARAGDKVTWVWRFADEFTRQEALTRGWIRPDEHTLVVSDHSVNAIYQKLRQKLFRGKAFEKSHLIVVGNAKGRIQSRAEGESFLMLVEQESDLRNTQTGLGLAYFRAVEVLAANGELRSLAHRTEFVRDGQIIMYRPARPVDLEAVLRSIMLISEAVEPSA